MSFEVIPAIDLIEGQVVRLRQGKRDQVTVYSGDPAATARRWEAAGARRLHVVDLDGAFEGAPRNLEAVAAICRATSMEVELGGGLRRLEDVEAALAAGVRRVALGTRAFQDEEFLRRMIKRLGSRLIVGVDARDGFVSLQGWVEKASTPAVEFIARLGELGVSEIIFTDIATDGMMTGPNVDSLREVAQAAPATQFIASGGVRSLEDVLALRRLELANLAGVITGKAIYEGALDLAEAIAQTR